MSEPKYHWYLANCTMRYLLEDESESQYLSTNVFASNKKYINQDVLKLLKNLVNQKAERDIPELKYKSKKFLLNDLVYLGKMTPSEYESKEKPKENSTACMSC